MPTPVTLGTFTNTGSSTTLAFVCSANIQAGDLVVAYFAGSDGGTNSPTSVSDGTNTYTKVVDGVGAGGWSGLTDSLWYVKNASAVTSPTITATFPSAATNRMAGGARVPGMDTSAPLDKSGSQGQATGGTIATGTLTQASEVIFGFAHCNTTTPTASSGFTQLNTTSAAAQGIQLEYQVVSSTASVNIAPGAGTSYNIGFGTFKVAAASTIFVNAPMMGL